MKTLQAFLVATASTRPIVRALLATHAHVQVAAEASTLQASREVLAKLRVDVVLLESALRDEDGFELLPSIPIETRVICLTHGARDMMRAMSFASLDCVPLPIEPRALNDALDAVSAGTPISSLTDFSFASYHLPGQFSL